jgi:hypothetical protein
MVTDGQTRKLWRLLESGKKLAAAARMTGMDEKTARHYREEKRLPSQRKTKREYRTRVDPFAEVWTAVQQRLEAEPRLQAITLFAWLQERYPGRYLDSTRRTFERRVRRWRSLCGPNQPVIFPQEHPPGRVAASDFTTMNDLGVKIAGARFDHMLFHCVLTYSNVESVSLCFSESFEALSDGVQKAFWEFGGVPKLHRTDSLSAAVNNHSSNKELRTRYQALMDHYRVQAERINVRCANENGDVESSHGHIKTAIDQALLLRGSRDFESRDSYMAFVEQLVAKRNRNRADRFAIEQQELGPLPDHQVDSHETIRGISVSKSSIITIRRNVYSVPSRFIGETVDVTIHAEFIDVTHYGHFIQRMPRLMGVDGAAINYRHVIDSLIRKPGAFENYKYREDMFPTSHFRMAYDMLCAAHSAKVAVRKYLEILALAARESQEAVQEALRHAINAGPTIDVEAIRAAVIDSASIPPATAVEVEPPNLDEFDGLLEHFNKEGLCHDDVIEEAALLEDEERAQGDDNGESGKATDRTVSRASAPELSGSLQEGSRASGNGATQSHSVSIGTDDAGMPGPTPGADSTLTNPIASLSRQDLGGIRFDSATTDRGPSVRNLARRELSRSPGEPAHLWQTRLGEESFIVCVSRTVSSYGTEYAIHDVQFLSPTVTDCQTGFAVAEVHQATCEFRRADHRRPGLCAADARGDGSAVYTTRGTLRTGQRAVDEQPALQQMGSDIQRSHDHGGGHRPPGSSQRDPRTEHSQLPRRRGQTRQDSWPLQRDIDTGADLAERNSNCR